MHVLGSYCNCVFVSLAPYFCIVKEVAAFIATHRCIWSGHEPRARAALLAEQGPARPERRGTAEDNQWKGLQALDWVLRVLEHRPIPGSFAALALSRVPQTW